MKAGRFHHAGPEIMVHCKVKGRIDVGPVATPHGFKKTAHEKNRGLSWNGVRDPILHEVVKRSLGICLFFEGLSGWVGEEALTHDH